MKRFFEKVKNDNKGMTLLLAVVAVAFVGILAASIVSATMTNYRLKMMDKYSKEAFYNADSVVEEIRTGIGIKCFDALSDAYNYTASNLLYQSSLGGGGVSLTQKTNAEANQAMKLRYMTLMRKTICGDAMVLTDRDKVLTFLNSFITNPNNAKVISFRYVNEDITNFGYTIEDVTIEYKKSDGNPYYSTVAVDIDIKYPDIDIDFISDRKELKSYLNYCLIAMDDITVGYQTVRGYATISGGAYAGTNGLNICPGSRFHLTDHIKVGTQTKVPTRLVTSGDVVLLEGGSNALFQVDGADVWCNNIIVGKDTHPGTVLYTSTDARTFVADDLSLEGNESNITIKGTYLGFGSNNANTVNPNKKNSSTSSAIVVNGRNCTLDLTGIKTLLLAGKAYVDLEDTQEYLTGDSLALKGNQEIYLVPMAYVKKSGDTANPLNVSNPTRNPDDVKIELDEFFAAKLGLLSDRKYITREANGKTYFYLDFRNDDKQNEYVKCILEDKYLENCLIKGGFYENRHITERDSIYSTVEMGISRFFDKNTAITLASNARIFSTGMLAEVTPGMTGLPNINLHNADSIQVSDVVGMSTSTANKYKIINAYLDVEEDASYATFPNQIVIDGGTYDVDPNNLPNIYDLVIDKEELDKLENNIIHKENGIIAAVITSKDNSTSSRYVLPNDVLYGVVLAYGVDVEVSNSNFEGLIITDKKITVLGDSKVTTGDSNRAELTLDVYNDVAKYFYMFKETSDTKQIEELDIDDVLELSNWRKNENA